MDFAMILLLCIFASVGVVQVLGWGICRLLRPRQAFGSCRVVLAGSREPAAIEAYLRYQLALLHWYGGDGVLFVVEEDALDLAREAAGKLLSKGDPVALCTPGEVAGMLRCPKPAETS